MDAASAPILEVKDLTIQFGGLIAVNEVSFQVKKSELLGIIGPNGAGKSTTFSAIAGVYSPTRGDILFQNKSIAGFSADQVAAIGIGRTFQLVRLFKSMTVLENVMVASSCVTSNMKEARKKAFEVVEMIGLKERAYHQVTTVPLADQKKTEIARALALEPKVLLLDEMMSGLNPTETDEVVNLIRRINAEKGLTIIVIEHVLRVIMALSQRIIVLDHGKLIAEGAPKDVINNPLVIEAYLGRKHNTNTEIGAH